MVYATNNMRRRMGRGARMHVKKKNYDLLFVSMIILVVALINVFVYRATRLKEPVFLTHTYAVEPTNDQVLYFYYITNMDQKENIMHILFPELKGEGHAAILKENKKIDDYGTYSLYEMAVNVPFADTLHNKETITQMEVVWSDHRHTTVDIGTLKFLEPSQDLDVFHEIQESSDEVSTKITFTPEKNITLNGLKVPLEGNLEDLFLFCDDTGKSLDFPLQCKAGKEMSLYIKWNIPSRNEHKHFVMALTPYIEIQCADGTRGVLPISYDMTYHPKWSTQEIYRISAMKGVS